MIYAVVTAIAALMLSEAAAAQAPVVVATPARAGAVDGTTENSDAFIWRLFTEFTAPASHSDPSRVVFETWASDDNTFSTSPHWPSPGEPMRLRASVLAAVKALSFGGAGFNLMSSTIDVPCKAPPGAAVGGFPSGSSPAPCIAEQVQRNRSLFDYIVNNNLNTKAGLAAAYAKSFDVEMPPRAIAVKGDWIPLPNLLQWVPQLSTPPILRNYITRSKSTQ
jgi:hypothetical protein